MNRFKQVLCCLAAVMAVPMLFAADPTISLTATPRYPWNGKVDLKFTIDGTSGTKYDTSFTAKDIAGGTNLTMKALYKSDGAAANVAKEQLLPGTYNWVWDATADLASRWPSYAGCVPTSSTVLFKDAQLAAIAEFYATPCGTSISDKSNRTKGRWIKADGAGKAVQFAFSDDKYTKCVCVHFEQSGANVVGNVKWASYVTGLGREGEDFDANSATTQTIATSETTAGYGLCKMEVRILQSDTAVVLDRVMVEGKVEKVLDANTATYMVIDLSGGSSAKSYPVSYLDAMPSGGWTDEYKTSKLVLRKIKSGSNSAGGSMANDMWVGVFEVTGRQYYLVKGSFSEELGGGTRYKPETNSKSAVGCMDNRASGFLSTLKSKSGIAARLATSIEWQYACRAGTTTDYNNGTSASSANMSKVGWHYGNASSRTTTPGIVGMFVPNAWGLYDMHGNVYEMVSDLYYVVGGGGTYHCGGGYTSASGSNPNYSQCKSSSKNGWESRDYFVFSGIRVFADVK